MEWAHGTLKVQLQKIKTGKLHPQSPHNALNHALFVLNFLNVDAAGKSAADRFWHEGTTGGKIHLLAYGRAPTLFYYGDEGMFVLFDRKKMKLMAA